MKIAVDQHYQLYGIGHAPGTIEADSGGKLTRQRRRAKQRAELKLELSRLKAEAAQFVLGGAAAVRSVAQIRRIAGRE